MTPFEAEECAELIYVDFFKGAKKQKNAEEQDILGSMNAAFLTLMFTALGHALFDWASGEKKTAIVFNHLTCLGECSYK